MKITGPNFEVEQGAMQAWELTPDDAPADDYTAVIRLGRRVLLNEGMPLAEGLQSSYRLDYIASRPGIYDYQTVYQDDCEISGGVVLVSVDASVLPGIEYLWQVDMLDSSGGLMQRWRGLFVVTGGLAPL